MSIRAIFAWPLLIGIASFAGLIVGLLGAGWFDGVCWLGLIAPLAALGRAWVSKG